MQAVGRPCVLCSEKISNAGQGVGCVRCDLVVHNKCARLKAGTYRDLPSKREVPCPTCGVELRAEQRERDARDARERDATRPTTLPDEKHLDVGGRRKFGWTAFGLLGVGFARGCPRVLRAMNRDRERQR